MASALIWKTYCADKLDWSCREEIINAHLGMLIWLTQDQIILRLRIKKTKQWFNSSLCVYSLSQPFSGLWRTQREVNRAKSNLKRALKLWEVSLSRFHCASAWIIPKKIHSNYSFSVNPFRWILMPLSTYLPICFKWHLNTDKWLVHGLNAIHLSHECMHEAVCALNSSRQLH